MEVGASQSDKEQTQMEKIRKTEMEAAATSKTYIDSEINLNELKQEPRFLQSVKSEPAFLVKDEILEDSGQDSNRQQCAQGTSTPSGTDRVCEAYSESLGGLLNTKLENIDIELEDMDLGPTVLQHMDIHYTINKKMSSTPEEYTIVDDFNKAMPCNEAKKESVEDKFKDNKTISCKYWGQEKTEDECDEAYRKSCHGQQKGLEQHLLHEFRATSFVGFKSDACKRIFRKPRLLTHKKLQDRNNSKISVSTSTAVTGHSNQSRKRTMKQKPFVSDVCEKGCSSKAGLNFHKQSHSGIELSDAGFTHNGALTSHKRVHVAKVPHQCDTCDRRFARKYFLTKHMRVHTGEKPYQCDTCNVKFAQKESLTRHMRVHTGEKPYQCDKCNVKFAQRSHLTAHMRVHTAEKPYQCNTCNVKFAQKNYLTAHIRIHTGEKPYQCDTCNVKFAQRGQLTSHARVHTGEKPYQCNTCNVKFAHKSYLIKHMRVHTGEKPYQCETCKVKFAQKNYLNSHIRVHTGEKPYQCDTCNVKFAHRSQLTSHTRVHTGEKPYQCNT